MANINKISSFKSFSEVKSQESTVKLREANNTKRQETVNKLASILDEMGLTSLEGLEEVQRNGIIDKMFPSGSLEKVVPPTPPREKLKEGNAFGDAVRKAKEAGNDEFDFEGKTFKVEESIFNEALKDDYTAKYNTTEITLKNGYKQLKSTALNNMYNKVGELIKEYDVNVKSVIFNFDPNALSEATVLLDTTDPEDKVLQKFIKKHNIKMKDTSVRAGGDFAEYEYTGKRKDLETMISDFWGDDDLIEFIEESIANEGFEKSAIQRALKANGYDLKQSDVKLGQKKKSGGYVQYTLNGEVIGSNDYSMDKLIAIATEKIKENPKKFKLEELKEGNAFGDAVRKAKEAGDDEFDFEGKTFKVEESIKESFYRLPKKVISNDLYVLDNRMQQLTSVVSNGSDLDIKALDNIISMLQDVRKSAKKFDKKEDLLGTVYESFVNEAKGFKNTKDFEDFLEEIDAMGEYDIKKFMGRNYIDTPGGYRDEADDYDNDITKYMISNMGLTEFNELKTYWENNVRESFVNEAKGFKNTKDFEDFLEEIDAMGEYDIKKFMGRNYIDTPGGYRDEADDYDNDITKYMISNMGLTEFNELKTYWENNVRESFVNEADIKSDDEFKDYAVNLLKKAFGDEFDEDKSQEVIDGILQKSDGDYGAAVGMLTSSLG
jgi:predicted acetyltransferase